MMFFKHIKYLFIVSFFLLVLFIFVEVGITKENIYNPDNLKVEAVDGIWYKNKVKVFNIRKSEEKEELLEVQFPVSFKKVLKMVEYMKLRIREANYNESDIFFDGDALFILKNSKQEKKLEELFIALTTLFQFDYNKIKNHPNYVDYNDIINKYYLIIDPTRVSLITDDLTLGLVINYEDGAKKTIKVNHNLSSDGVLKFLKEKKEILFSLTKESKLLQIDPIVFFNKDRLYLLFNSI